MSSEKEQLGSLDELPDEMKREPDEEVAMMYYRIDADQDLLSAVDDIWELLVDAGDEFPNKRFGLGVDIEGHRNSEGGYDDEMFILQKDVLTGILFRPFLHKLVLPLGDRHIEAKEGTPVFNPTDFMFNAVYDDESEDYVFNMFVDESKIQTQ